MRRARHSLSSVRALAATALCSLAASFAPASAGAFTEPGITGSFADLANCPLSSPLMAGETSKCAHSYTTGGFVQIGHSSVPISVPGDTFDLGIEEEEALCPLTSVGPCVVSPPHGILNGPAQPVPGGLLGAIGNVRLTGVKAKLEWATTVPPNTAFGSSGICAADPLVTFDLCKLLTGKSGTAATLTVKVHLTSPFLGPNCYIGSATEPIVIPLTTGATNPPPPNAPIHGRPFERFVNHAGNNVLGLDGLKLVNNSFSVPAARGCGTSTGDLVDQAINHKIGLPSPAGQNTIVVHATGEEQSGINVLERGWTDDDSSPGKAIEETSSIEGIGPSAVPGVPSGRTSELVSPVAKNGLSPYAAVPSEDGKAVDFQARGALPGTNTGALNLYGATRGSDGWETTPLTPTPSAPLGALELQVPVWTSPDLSQTIFTTPASYAPEDQDGGALSLYRSDSNGQALLSQGTQGGTEMKGTTYGAATPDGQHIVFSSGASLLSSATGLDPAATPEAQYLYERDVIAGETHLLSLDPGGHNVGYSTTTLANAYAPGQGGIVVAREKNFFPGQFITIGTGPSAETTQIFHVHNIKESTEELVVGGGSGLSTAYPVGTVVTHTYEGEGAILGDGGNVNPGPPPAAEGLPASAGSGSTTNAISSDGSKVFFESPNPVLGLPVGLYLREDNSTTVQIAGARQYATAFGEVFSVTEPLFGSARYEGAAENGSLAFFSSEEGLAGATLGKELYEFNTTSHEIGGVAPSAVGPVSAGLGGDKAPVTTLTAGTVANEEPAKLTVASTTGFAAGEAIAFGPFEKPNGEGATGERAVIASVDSATQMTLSSALTIGGYELPSGTEVHGVHPASVTAISNDGSHVYFVSDGGILANNQNSQGAKAIPAKPNLYLFDTTSGETTFIATVAKSDVEDSKDHPTGLAARLDISRPAVPTPDGKVLAFASAANLTGQNPWEKHTEIYRYSVSGEELQCLSCTEPGVRPTGDATFGETAGGTYAPPGLTSPITEDGSMVFFDTPDSLVSADQNAGSPPSPKFDDPTSTDVYQWSEKGLSLISSGIASTPATLQGTTPSGHDVLFTATQTVPGQDESGYENVIDARLGGGFPEPGAGTPSCVGVGCREAFGPAPVFAPPATQSTQGEVNPSPTKKAKKKHRKKHHGKKRANKSRRASR